MHKIFDDFLEQSEFLQVKNAILNSSFSWNLSPFVSSMSENLKITSSYYFTHLIYDETYSGEVYKNIEFLIKKLNPNKLIRIKANLYPSTEQIEEHENHTDYDYENCGAIYYLNTNNGFTILENEIKVESIQNRLLIFDASKEHKSTTCSDDKCRVNINFNFL
tara:strand:- start:930 stop:1418 length:489 start_codon:yes stop_codon:yes gene_type:complete